MLGPCNGPMPAKLPSSFLKREPLIVIPGAHGDAAITDRRHGGDQRNRKILLSRKLLVAVWRLQYPEQGSRVLDFALR
jgi:hypothetical protein